jgi:putative CocE/NonD family hydrolase
MGIQGIYSLGWGARRIAMERRRTGMVGIARPIALTILVIAVLAAVSIVALMSEELAHPLDVLEDAGGFSMYLNEEVLVTESFEWAENGSFASDYTLSLAGQEVVTRLVIEVEDKGIWTGMKLETALGPVEVARDGAKLKITTPDEVRTVELRRGTLLYENFSPALMSQAISAYDDAEGGVQTFPLFIIPSAVVDLELERLETVERTVMGSDQEFTLYRYGLPGVDIIVWVDGGGRVCLGDVPAQHGTYVRDGYEALMFEDEPDSLVSQPDFEVAVDRNVGIPMRDGVELATDIYRPEADGVFPVILVRTPYKKELNVLQAKYFARRGYVYAVQDCRGRFSSPGTWDPFFNEPADGYDTIEWLAVRPWSNGKVGMIGASYLGWVQWWAAREHPPHLVTMIPNVAPPDPYFNIPYEYGAFFLLGAILWADILEQEATADLSGRAIKEIAEKKYARLLRHLPVIEIDELVLGGQNRYWREWIEHPNNDEYWARASFLDYLGHLDIPVYHQSGWFDGDGIGSKLNYLAMARHGHRYQKLVLGPWGHTPSATRRGPRNTDFGKSAIVDLEKSYLRWLDRWLKGIDNGIDREPLVSIFVMGTNRWLTGDTYPLAGTRFTRFYLASDGSANTSLGDGRLTASIPGDAAAGFDFFTYDPGDPTPDPNFYVDPEDLDAAEDGGDKREVSLEREYRRRFEYYARVNSQRQDILVYETEPLDQPLTLAGPISAVLYASSSAEDTDWFMRLSQVGRDGTILPLVHGVIRARYRNSFAEPEMLIPGEIYEYHLDMWQTGITVPEDARLRAEVASASFPMFSRNLNTGGHNEMEDDFAVAEQRVYHTPDYPSHILLPVIPEPDFKQTVLE